MVRRRQGQEASLAPPCSNLRLFGRKFAVLKKVLVKLLGFSAPLTVIRRPYNDPAPGELCPPCPPSLRPWMIYVCSAPLLVDCNAFWIFVVAMLLNTKSCLIVAKHLVIIFAPKSINNLFHQMFSECCTCTILWPSEILGTLLKVSLKDDDDIQRQVKSLYCAANMFWGTFD